MEFDDDGVTDRNCNEAQNEVQEENINISIVEPYVGMEFSTFELAYEFYNSYAKKKGFGIRKHTTNRSRIDKNKVISRIYVCCKEGQSKTNTRRSRRSGCNARIKIILTSSNTWKISQFEENHKNHILFTSPAKIMKHRSHNRLHRSTVVKKLINELHDEGLGPSASVKVVNLLSGSQHEVVTPQQCQTHLRVARKNNIGRECIEIIKYFQDKRHSDPDFYFSIQLDQDQTLRSVFWADGRSRSSYLQFADVIVFDVTYKTNKFSLPFSPFTGVNHHRQSCLFGCALLADETEETFVWLFEVWLTCMWGKAPKSIITDQDHAICNAIERVFPETRHRYCKWHLDKHIAQEMIHLISSYGPDIENELKKLENSCSILEADRIWEIISERYKFENNSWISKLWRNRHHWMPCYLKDVFTAGMTTSQRSESMNAFFDGYIHSHTPLDEFVKQYNKALVSRRTAEENADFKTLDSNAKTIWKSSMEEHAGECYTSAMFNIFQRELLEGALYWSEKVSKEGTQQKYIVGPSNNLTSKGKLVTFDNSNGVAINCQCGMFEVEGILCRHSLFILNKKKVSKIPPCYILDRWTIDARFRVSNIGSHNMESDNVDVNQMMMWTVHSKFSKLFEIASKSSIILKRLDSYLTTELIEAENLDKVKSTKEYSKGASSFSTNANTIPLIPEITIYDPQKSKKGKGRPRIASRIKSGMEISKEQSQKKQRTCGSYGGIGHNRIGCHKHGDKSIQQSSDK